VALFLKDRLVVLVNRPALCATFPELFFTLILLRCKVGYGELTCERGAVQVAPLCIPTGCYVRWVDKRWGKSKETDYRDWFKAHRVCGVRTKIVAGVDISGWTMHDGYFHLSHKNFETVEAVGGLPFIPFKTRNVAPKDDGIWAKMYHLFHYRREEFLAHYHKRSSVESAFSMMKAKFGSSVRSKSEVGQVNEALCKVLCHNLTILVRVLHELGIEPRFVQHCRSRSEHEPYRRDTAHTPV
jgi:hypothetical protein